MAFENFNVLIIDPNREKISRLQSVLESLGVRNIFISAHFKLIGDLLEKTTLHLIYIGDDFLTQKESMLCATYACIPKQKKFPAGYMLQ